MSIYISMNSASRDTEARAIYRAIVTLAARITRIRHQQLLPNGPGLDITFMIPGQFEAPPFEGMRMGGFSHRSKHLRFEVAVPRHLVDSDQASHYTHMVLLDAIDHAGYYFRDHYAECRVEFDASLWHRALISLLAPANDETTLIREVCYV